MGWCRRGAECTYLVKARIPERGSRIRSLGLSRFRVCALHLLPPTGMKRTREGSDSMLRGTGSLIQLGFNEPRYSSLKDLA
jgi:hypothetical protein